MTKTKDLDYWVKRVSHGAIRLALTGKAVGFPIEDVIRILGEEESIKRFERFCKQIENMHEKE